MRNSIRSKPRCRRSSGIVPADHGRAPATRMVAEAVRPGLLRNHPAMRKLFVVAVLSLAAFALGVAPASAGWFCHGCCGRLGACATQYNAFSPYCVTGVYTSSHCHRCMHPSQGPCCGGYNGCNSFNADGCCTINGGSAMLGELPAPVATGMVPGNQTMVPLAPTPVPAIPGVAAPMAPTRTFQPLQ